MVLTHYLELLWYYRRVVALLLLGLPLAVATVSTALLYAVPIYAGTATVSILPTTPELTYTDRFLGATQAPPATIISQTHIEHLVSRTVARRTVDRLVAEFGAPAPSERSGLAAELRRGLNAFKRNLRRYYNVLNSGRHVPRDAYTDAILTLQDNVKVEMVEGTYILKVSVSWDDPEVAAAATNMLADAYVASAREETMEASTTLEAFVNDEIRQLEEQLAQLRGEQSDLNRRFGFVDAAAERESLLDAREQERARLADAEADLAAYERRIDTLEQSRDLLRLAGRDEVAAESLALYASERAELASRVDSRRGELAAIASELARLREQKVALDGVALEITTIEGELTDLKDRAFTLRRDRATGLNSLRVIDQAVTPLYPSFPKVVLFTLIAGAASVVLVAFAVVALDTFTNTVKTEVDLERQFPGHTLGRISARGRRLPRRRVRELARRLRLAAEPDPARGAVMAVGDDSDGATAARAVDLALGADAAGGVANLGGTAGQFSLAKLGALASTWLVVAAPAGLVSEEELAAVADEARERGTRTVFAVLLAR